MFCEKDTLFEALCSAIVSHKLVVIVLLFQVQRLNIGRKKIQANFQLLQSQGETRTCQLEDFYVSVELPFVFAEFICHFVKLLCFGVIFGPRG